MTRAFLETPFRALQVDSVTSKLSVFCVTIQTTVMSLKALLPREAGKFIADNSKDVTICTDGVEKTAQIVSVCCWFLYFTARKITTVVWFFRNIDHNVERIYSPQYRKQNDLGKILWINFLNHCRLYFSYQIFEGLKNTNPVVDLKRWKLHQLNPKVMDEAALNW